jgi:NADH-quinone oxidoreductase subunit E
MLDMSKVEEIIESYGNDRSALIAILQDIQAEYLWLSPEVLRRVAEKLEIPLVDLFGIATFYKSFRLKPRGKYLITVCLGTACHVRGAPRILEELQRKLGIKEDETTKDNMFTLETVNCLGACALGPIVVVNEEYHGQMTKTKVDTLLTKEDENKKP